ncbi:microtubule-associated tumor suppressor 1 homolog isoform X2 [Amyelois transitella]|uniref:microtubule-associated tumor suppressor 1 homolog isoform X2 n=1 Tax=Amyelois transitella TaxID=680683 RepID=UPI0029907E61|nr:microtubule-associated tumor suppressor 1 homolog isoform X2 [Amyelois transitella]
MSSTSAVVCREIFDENSQPSAEEISDYAQQLGIDPESESHLLPLAKDGLMQALPPPWKAYYDEKLGTHYYYNEETKKTQWEHPLDNVYRELVKKARDASVQDDTCASVQELLTFEENTKQLERVETKVESDDDDLSTDSENQTDVKDNASSNVGKVPGLKRLTPLGRPPLAPLARLDKKLSDLRISPLRRSADSPLSNKPLLRNTSDRDLLSRQNYERPKMLFKQQSEIIDLKMHVLNSPEEENFSPFLAAAKVEKGLPLTGKGSMFLRACKSDLPSPDTDKSLPLDSLTKSDPPKGILREKPSDTVLKRVENVKQRAVSSFDEDRKSVRFKLENNPETTISPGSNSSSEQNDGQSSIISAAPISSPAVLSPPIISPPVPCPSIVLSPLVTRPPLPPRPVVESPKEKSLSVSEKDSVDSESRDSRGASPRRRVVRPPAADYIKPDLFQKNFQKISDLVRPRDIETSPINLEEPVDKDKRPRSPMIPLKNKISINLMESIESETSIDSPDREFANLDLNDLDESNEVKPKELNDDPDENEENETKDIKNTDTESSDESKTSVSNHKAKTDLIIPQIKVPKLEFSKKPQIDAKSQQKEESKSFESPKDKANIHRISPTPSYTSDLRSPRDFGKPWSPMSTFKPLNKAVIAPQIKSSESATSLGKTLTSPRLDGVIISQGKSSSDNVVVVYQFETQDEKPINSPLIPDMGNRDMFERNKADERRRLELSLQKELEGIRVEWATKERRMRMELQEELKVAEEKFLTEKRFRLTEQAERHRKELEEALLSVEQNHQKTLQMSLQEIEDRYKREADASERQHAEDMAKLREEYSRRLTELRQHLEIENERALSDVREQLHASWNRERARMADEHRANADSLRDEHSARLNDLKHDYRAEVERLRTQHACHLEELRARLANERAASGRNQEDRELAEKYRCLKQKYARLKHDVKMSIERRNKRREMSMTTGSETEKSNSHKATQSLERCKEANEISVSAVVEPEPRVRGPGPVNNNPGVKCDNETSLSESAHKYDNNNDDWKAGRANTVTSADTSQASAVKQRKTTVAFREPERRRRARDTHRETGATTDCQDSSDATTADEKPKESVNGHGRRRCFTRLKSASTSRLNYSPKRGEGWSSPLEALRQQLRKLDDLEDQFPDLACQPSYSLRYPFGEIDAMHPRSDKFGFVGKRSGRRSGSGGRRVAVAASPTR